MGRNKKSEYKPREFESELDFAPKQKNGKKKDTSSNIYYSMLMSNAWHELTLKQKELYLYCKLQYLGQRLNRDELETEKEADEGNTNISYRFTFNKGLWCELYGLYSENGKRHFYDDMQVLIDKGFIRLVASGQNTRTKNIYEFSNKWAEKGKWVNDKGKNKKENKTS